MTALGDINRRYDLTTSYGLRLDVSPNIRESDPADIETELTTEDLTLANGDNNNDGSV
ncbi:hypothetical protein VTK26DRAFT_1027 [Humicola hyalothermophila]